MDSRRRRSLLVGLALGVVLTVAGVVVIQLTTGDDVTIDRDTSVEPIKGNGEALPIATLLSFDDSPIQLQDFVGHPLLINFFSSTCAPCIKEMPALEAMHRKFGDQVRFLGVDHQDDKAEGRKLVEATGITYEVARNPRGDLLPAVNGVLLPTTVLVGSDGTILETHPGALTEQAITDLITKYFPEVRP